MAANLGARDDHVFPAMDAAHELISLRPRSIARAAQAAFHETGSLYVASVLLRQESIRAADRRMIEGKVLDLAHSIQRDASEGKYSMGLVRTGALLGRLAISASRARLFDEALSFAFNARVPLEERIAVVESFLEEPEKVPKRFKHRLARGLPAAQIGIPLFGTPTDLEGINLRLAAIFGDMSPDRVLGPLLRLAHSASQDARLQAVHAMPAVERLLDSGTFLAILVGLTHDPDPFVRASGGNSLASAQLPDAVQPVRTARLVELLEEPGGLVPRAVWLGLAQSRRSGESPSPELEARAERVAAGHIAYSVRRAATDFIASRHADALQ